MTKALRAAPLLLSAALALACGSKSSAPPAGGTGGGAAGTPNPFGSGGGSTPATFSLHVTVSGAGTIHSALGDCRSDCKWPAAAAQAVQLSAQPDAGQTFLGWTGACSGTGSCTVTPTTDLVLTASFAAPPPPQAIHLNVTVDGLGSVTGGGISCGSGANLCQIAVAKGTVVALAASAGSGANFQGWSGACSGGSSTCNVTVTADTAVTAQFGSQLTVLAPPDGTPGPVMAINSTTLFYQRDHMSDGAELWAVPKTGGTPHLVAAMGTSHMALQLAADDSYLYVIDAHNGFVDLLSIPVGGGQFSDLGVSGQIGGLSIDDAGAIYVTSRNTSGPGAKLLRIQNRVQTVLVDNPALWTGLDAVDASSIFFATVDPSYNVTLQQMPRTGGAAQTVLTWNAGSQGMQSPAAIAVSSTYIYVQDHSGQVYAIDRAHPSLKVISASASPGAVTQVTPGVATDGSSVFWTWEMINDNAYPGGIYRANADGSSGGAVDAPGGHLWSAPLVDGSALYYLRPNTGIVRRTK